ncbi:MAG: undecaprenyldiphospho-muramoylpentapeptide beta-N-acetylglucosaminyltransferase [Candidatus Sericytochromatia bacterium]|nr:undecaprenyldiphospho-muramoylpentapeptide beta-N-acetylglucosaminyltransferase [Candidatus Tanganyikabacteria bacterium]
MILFAAGGTGGHLYPALAIAEEIRRRHPEMPIAFAGTPDHLEAEIVPREGYPFHPIPVIGLPRRPGPALLRFAWLLGRAVLQARNLIRTLRPSVVVGCGAYVSVPCILAARVAGVPTVVAESNGYPGIANRLVGRFADLVAVAIPGTERAFPPGKAVCLGNPIRADFGKGDRVSARAALAYPRTPHLLVVTGGSLGAQALNESFVAMLPQVLARHDWSVLHIAGARHVADVVTATGAVPGPGGAYTAHHDRYRVVAYCDRMADALLAADLLVSRSGATIVAEIAAAGRASLLVPLGINPDQAANARFLADQGAAVVLPNDRVKTDLAAALLPLLGDTHGLERMALAARTLGKPDAARRIADEVLRLAGAM